MRRRRISELERRVEQIRREAFAIRAALGRERDDLRMLAQVAASALDPSTYTPPQLATFNLLGVNILGRSPQANIHAYLSFWYSPDNATWTRDVSGDIDMGLTDASGDVSTTVLANTNASGSPAPRVTAPYSGLYVGYSAWCEYPSGHKFVVTPAGPTPSAPPQYKPLQGVTLNPSAEVKPWAFGTTSTSNNQRLVWSGGSTWTDDWKTLTLPSCDDPWGGSSNWQDAQTFGPYTVTGSAVLQRYASGGVSYYDASDTPASLPFEIYYSIRCSGSSPITVQMWTPFAGAKTGGVFYPLSKTAIGGTAPNTPTANYGPSFVAADSTLAYPATWSGNWAAGAQRDCLFGLQGKSTAVSWQEGTALF